MAEAALTDLLNFNIGSEIKSNNMPLRVITEIQAQENT
jgi:hypothetical protein